MPRPHCSRNLLVAMSTATVVLLFILSLTIYSSAINTKLLQSLQANSDNDSLQLLHVVFRHGARTPADTYPTDPHVDEKFYPFGWGQITNDGKRQLFSVGEWLRKRYSSFLGPLYQPDMVHAQATGVTRTHVSLATVLAGLFPPKDTALDWNPSLNWQAIPIFSQTLNEDNFLLVRTPCPRYYEALQEVFQLPEVQKVIKESQPLFKELTEKTGLNITTAEDVQSVYTTLLAEKEFGLELPAWTKKLWPEKMQFLTEISYVYNVYTTEMQKIKGGPFLKKMFSEMAAKRDNKLKPSARKLNIYTGHDSTVVNIMSALKIWERQLPKYAIMTIFELHKNPITEEYYVQIYLRNDIHNENPIPMTVPGCDFRCPLDKLMKLAADVIPGTEMLCAAKDPLFEEPPPSGP